MLGRAFRLLSLLPVRPLEFWDRVSALVDLRLDRLRSRPSYEPVPWERAVTDVGRWLGADGTAVLAEPALHALEATLTAATDRIRSHAPYPLGACGDFYLGRLCYLACRALRPAVVVETGVLYGVTSSFILQALAVNGAGTLHSIDLPPLRREQEKYVGCLIPDELRARWKLHRGASSRVMPRLRDELPSIDVFVHDSLHTYRNMRWEFAAASQRLAARALLISDDIHGNEAFLEWARRPEVRHAAAVRQHGRDGLFGVALCGTDATA